MVRAMHGVFERAKQHESTAEAEELCQQHGLVFEKVCNYLDTHWIRLVETDNFIVVFYYI